MSAPNHSSARYHLQVFERHPDGGYTGRSWVLDDQMWAALHFEKLAQILGPPKSEGLIPAEAVGPAADAIADHGGVIT
jgi:hypothetical protein